MEVIAILALVGGVGYGMEHDWQAAKALQSYQECRAENPKFHNTMTQWKYDPCNLAAYHVKKSNVMKYKEALVSIIALVTAFVGGDYLDSVEPTVHTHVISEECTVIRNIEKEM